MRARFLRKVGVVTTSRWVNYARRETWATLNRQTELELQLDTPKTSAKLYRGLHAGLVEIAFGLARQFPFKKQILYFKGLDPFIDFAALAFLKEGLKVTALGETELTQVEALKEKLGKETLMVLWSEDDPFLGLLHPLKSLASLLDEAKIFSVRVSHSAFRFRTAPSRLLKHQIELQQLQADVCVALLGERARFSDWLAEGFQWSEGEFEAIRRHLVSLSSQQVQVSQFERNLPAGFTAPFREADRIFDRALFNIGNHDAFAFIELLKEQLELLPLQPPGEDPLLETPSLSRWGGIKIPDCLLRLTLNPEELRGLVIAHTSILDRLTPAVLVHAQQELLRLSSSRFKG